MRRFDRWVDTSMTGVVFLLGLWTLFAQLAVLRSASFEWLASYAWVPLLAALAFVVMRPKAPVSALASEREVGAAGAVPARLFWWIGGAAAAAVIYSRWENDYMAWILLVGGLLLQWRAGVWEEEAPETTSTTETGALEVSSVLALALASAFITSVVNVPHADDAYFLSIMRAALSQPEAALQSFDALHLDGSPPMEQAQHLPQTYELGIAALARALSLNPGQLYYVLLPPLWAFLGTLVQWRVARHFLPRDAALTSTAVLIALLVMWGDGNRTFGSFGFPRLFQGKSVYILFLMPLIFWNALRFREHPDWRRWAVLALTQLAASGITVNAVALGPVTAGLVLIAPPWHAGLVPPLVGIAASIPTLLPVVLMYPRLAPYLRA